MSQSLQSPMRVAVQIRHREHAGYRFRIGSRAISSHDSPPWAGTPTLYNLPATPSASGTTLFASVIANLHSRIGVLLAGGLDRGGPYGDRLPASFFPRQGTFSGIVNLCRPQVTAGKCFSFLRSLVQHPQKSGRSGFHALSLSPIVSQVHVSKPVVLQRCENNRWGDHNGTKNPFQIRK